MGTTLSYFVNTGEFTNLSNSVVLCTILTMSVSLALHYTYLTTLSTVECVADASGVTKREGQLYKRRSE